MKKNSVLVAQAVGILVLALAMFGIDIDADTQKDLIAGLSAIGLIVTTLADRFQKSKEDKSEP